MQKGERYGTRSLSDAEKARLTPGQRRRLGIGVVQTGLEIPGDTNGGTDFSTVPQTPGALSSDGTRIVPVGTPGSTAPPNPGQTPSPGFYAPDDIYNEALSTIAANRRRTLDSATEGERALAGDYGLGITQDDTGAKFTGQWAASDANMGGIDPSNPFSRASLLNKSFFSANRIGEGSYANRGLLTSGAYQRSQQRNAFGFEQGRDQLLRQFASGLQGYRDRRSQAESDASSQGLSARNDLFNRRRDIYDRTERS
jgi:hypothetical protein